MVICSISSGLGNQFFQYATARRVAYITNNKLKLDISYYNENHDRKFCLKYFNINADIASKEEIRAFEGKIKNTFILKFRRKIFNPPFIKLGKYHIKEEPLARFSNKILRIKTPILINGYWQHENYFKDIRNLLLNELSLKKEYMITNNTLKKIETTESVSIHIRRGDYLKNQNYHVSEIEYFLKAIHIIRRKYNRPVFYIFSDDMNWAKVNLKLNDANYIENQQEYSDFNLMCRCKHNIISNSTFSWWSAWLNNNPLKTVIAPIVWADNYKLQRYYSQRDFIPKGWIKL